MPDENATTRRPRASAIVNKRLGVLEGKIESLKQDLEKLQAVEAELRGTLAELAKTPDVDNQS